MGWRQDPGVSGVRQALELRRHRGPVGLEQRGPGPGEPHRPQRVPRVGAVGHGQGDGQAELVHAGGVAVEPGAVQGQLHPVIADGTIGVGGVGGVRLDQAAAGGVHPQVERGADAEIEPAADDGQGWVQVQVRGVPDGDAVVAPGAAVPGDHVVGGGAGQEPAGGVQVAEPALGVQPGAHGVCRDGGFRAPGCVDEGDLEPVAGGRQEGLGPGRGRRRIAGAAAVEQGEADRGQQDRQRGSGHGYL